MKYEALKREEVKSVIDGRGATGRVPVMFQFWINANTFGDRSSEVVKLFEKYPEDIMRIVIKMPAIYDAPTTDPEYRWVNFNAPTEVNNAAIDAQTPIDNWEMLENILGDFPDPNYSGMFSESPADDGCYRLGYWWYCFFERHWSLRGMANALMDFYTDPDYVHKLYRALTDFYLRVLERSKNELGIDGIITTDDIGTQTGPFFSPEIFREFFKPYYKELIDKAHSLGMHFWLHTCGNIEVFLPDLIEIGLDVIHPIQKYTMDEKVIAEKFGGDICILAGFDVQRTIPYGTPDEVRKEVRFMINTYGRPDGRLILTAGNAITSDCEVESLEALLDEAYSYGKKRGTKKRGTDLRFT